jgi:hypothetical protein
MRCDSNVGQNSIGGTIPATLGNLNALNTLQVRAHDNRASTVVLGWQQAGLNLTHAGAPLRFVAALCPRLHTTN